LTISDDPAAAAIRSLMSGENPWLRRGRNLFRLLPTDPRCKFCAAPFAGLGGAVMSRLGYTPWPKNPSICANCVARLPIGGVELEVTLLFADVRGSTALAETMSPTDFHRLLSAFYSTATHVLLEAGAHVDKVIGDEVMAFFTVGFAGAHHPRAAVQAAERLIRETVLPLGVGVHTGVAWVGAVGERGAFTDFTCLGDAVNLSARLVATAAAGECVLSEATYRAAHMEWANLEPLELVLKGKRDAVRARLLRIAPAAG
jgi:adenylate cyclase